MLAVAALLLPSLFVAPALAADKKKDPDQIGNRDVGKGLNFYSIEKEIAIGKQMAQEVERQAKIVDDPDHRRIRESRRAEPGAEFGRQGSFHD